MRIGAIVMAAGLALPATSALSEQASLAGDELRQAISGKTVYLKTGFKSVCYRGKDYPHIEPEDPNARLGKYLL